MCKCVYRFKNGIELICCVNVPKLKGQCCIMLLFGKIVYISLLEGRYIVGYMTIKTICLFRAIISRSFTYTKQTIYKNVML